MKNRFNAGSSYDAVLNVVSAAKIVADEERVETRNFKMRPKHKLIEAQCLKLLERKDRFLYVDKRGRWAINFGGPVVPDDIVNRWLKKDRLYRFGQVYCLRTDQPIIGTDDQDEEV
jgi:hypothetical protein